MLGKLGGWRHTVYGVWRGNVSAEELPTLVVDFQTTPDRTPTQSLLFAVLYWYQATGIKALPSSSLQPTIRITIPNQP